jgi:uncharacterized protein YndB with AHSA1/START domain
LLIYSTPSEEAVTDLIERELELTAGPAEVWRALTDPDALREWLADDAELELWPGGDAHFVVHGEPRSGWVEEVTPPREDGSGRLVFWWQADGEPASRVCLELDGAGPGTRVRVVEARPLEVLDVVGLPLPGQGGSTSGPMLVAAGAR